MKHFLKQKFPKLVKNYRDFKHFLKECKLKIKSNESIFTEIYQKNSWGGISKSGQGSDLNQTESIRKELPNVFRELKVSSILDIPCGDFFWMKEINLDFLSYTGADIVEELIISNTKKYSKKNRNFIKIDITKDFLPKVDLILCRDLLFHLSFEDIIRTIQKIKKSRSSYLLCTSNIHVKNNFNIPTGSWRPLNLQLSPIFLPEPIRIIHEKSTRDADFDKRLLLWKISNL